MAITKEKKQTTRKVGINEVAEKYQQLSREAKALEAKIKPLKDELLAYAKGNSDKFDEAFQIKFPNGSYVSLRVADVLKADERAREILIDNVGTNYLQTSLLDKELIEAARTNKLLQKQLTHAGARIEQKETYAVYAG